MDAKTREALTALAFFEGMAIAFNASVDERRMAGQMTRRIDIIRAALVDREDV